MTNIGYHTRLVENHTVKVVGGSFGGSFDMDTVNRLVKSHFTVKVKSSGRAVFVDRKGREVSLYVSVDPLTTDVGYDALLEYRRVQAVIERAEAEKRERLLYLIDSMDTDEAIKRLSECN